MTSDEALEKMLSVLGEMGFQSVADDCTDEEYDIAAAENIAVVRAHNEFNRELLRRVEAIAADHSLGAIWRRAYRTSIQADGTPGRAEKSRRWKARAIGLNPDPMHNAIALSGMAPIHFDDRWMIGVAIPQPAPIDDLGYAIEDVVLIDPRTGAATVMGDDGATHVAPPPYGSAERLPVLTDAKAWARQIALDRLEWWHLRGERLRMIQAEPTWNGWPTAALLLVDPKKMRWSELSASILEVPAEMRETVRRAVLTEARLPRIEGRA